MIILICIVVSLIIGFWLGYSYFLTKVCTGCRSIPSSNNKQIAPLEEPALNVQMWGGTLETYKKVV